MVLDDTIKPEELTDKINEYLDEINGNGDDREALEANYVLPLVPPGDSITGKLTDKDITNETSAGAKDGKFTAKVTITGDSGTFGVVDKDDAVIGTDDTLVDGTSLDVSRDGLDSTKSPFK